MESEFVQERNKIVNAWATLESGNKLQSDNYLLQLFQFQYKYNEIYHNYCKNINISPLEVTDITLIPYLPISAFKHHQVKSGNFDAEEIFNSSGTTGSARSYCHIRDLKHYLGNTVKVWDQYFPPVQNYCFLALLPGYLDREGSSLISMVNHFIQLSPYAESGFYLRNHKDLYNKLLQCKQQRIPTVLFGVTYALLDFVEKYTLSYPELIIMETGGMKGSRPEMSKVEVHQILKERLKTKEIYSEYGMTELLSQAYTKGGKIFEANRFLQVITHQINDPLSMEIVGKSGIICVADASNIDTCAFIQTDDIGIVYTNGYFEILGRLDTSDIRGCNLMIEELGIKTM
jgi:hypothetical protein